MSSEQKELRTFRDDLRIVIFEAGTRAGKAFDVGLIVLILASVVVVMLDSVPQIHARYGEWLYLAEWAFTVVFAIEYGLRLWAIQNRWAYARSFYGVVDLMGFADVA